jgi:hypothetical protein
VYTVGIHVAVNTLILQDSSIHCRHTCSCEYSNKESLAKLNVLTRISSKDKCVYKNL